MPLLPDDLPWAVQALKGILASGQKAYAACKVMEKSRFELEFFIRQLQRYACTMCLSRKFLVGRHALRSISTETHEPPPPPRSPSPHASDAADGDGSAAGGPLSGRDSELDDPDERVILDDPDDVAILPIDDADDVIWSTVRIIDGHAPSKKAEDAAAAAMSCGQGLTPVACANHLSPRSAETVTLQSITALFADTAKLVKLYSNKWETLLHADCDLSTLESLHSRFNAIRESSFPKQFMTSNAIKSLSRREDSGQVMRDYYESMKVERDVDIKGWRHRLRDLARSYEPPPEDDEGGGEEEASPARRGALAPIVSPVHAAKASSSLSRSGSPPSSRRKNDVVTASTKTGARGGGGGGGGKTKAAAPKTWLFESGMYLFAMSVRLELWFELLFAF